jgi:hypothetical protein
VEAQYKSTFKVNNAMNERISFFQPYFFNLNATEHFITSCELLIPSYSNHKASIMMHQTQRLVSIADDLPKLRPKRESLQLLFLMICVEHISKLHDDFTGEGYSKKYVKRFFNKFISQSDKDKLERSFIDLSSMPTAPLNFEKVIDLLYGVRCDVVHEGKYWDFFFQDGQMTMINENPVVEVCMTFKELRDIIIKSCITAINDKLKP